MQVAEDGDVNAPGCSLETQEDKEEEEEVVAVRRVDYRPYPYCVEEVSLDFDLAGDDSAFTSVHATLRCAPRPGSTLGEPMFLDGRQLKLVAVYLDGFSLREGSDYDLSSKGLTIREPPSKPFVLGIAVQIRPQENTDLEGLYTSGASYVSQCEAEGFRRIIFYPDRPDVLARYSVRITAPKEKYPVLLSNGNLCAEGELDGGRHFATWVDPFPKPSYLFGLVATTMEKRRDTFRTCGGRDVELAVWAEKEHEHKTEHAMRSIKTAMQWDEERFGLEYDLAIFQCVSIDDFNCGAMENKSLNIFNAKDILAHPASATDDDYRDIENCIAHEYFHNYTGNRVTCRDWFQLSLKEGLTVYRDQEFTADVTSRAVKRIIDVAVLREGQFPEDSGAMAHPVRPEEYENIDNFYSSTVYEKGAEVIRMYETLLGRERFRAGVRLYLERHDGEAATCDDFLQAMAESAAAGKAVSASVFQTFDRWYSQAGTPRLRIEWSHDAAGEFVTLHCSQTLPDTADWTGPEAKQPQVVPIRVGMLGSDGRDLPLQLEGDGREAEATVTVVLTQFEQSFKVLGVKGAPVPSFLRGFSAPVILEAVPAPTLAQLVFQLAHDTDEFNRWDAAQTVGRRMVLRAVQRRTCGAVLPAEEFAGDEDTITIDAYRAVLRSGMDELLIAKTMVLPGVDAIIAEVASGANPALIYEARLACEVALATALAEDLRRLSEECRVPGPYAYTHASAAKRALRNFCVGSLTQAGLGDGLAAAAHKTAANMTEQLGALRALRDRPGSDREEALASFYAQHRGDKLCIQKWLRIISSAEIPGNLEAVRGLLSHEAFDAKNPNVVSSVVLGFVSSFLNFHAADGSGYVFLADMVLQFDQQNAILAADLAREFVHWRKYDDLRQGFMRTQISRIAASIGLSSMVGEIVTKSSAA